MGGCAPVELRKGMTGRRGKIPPRPSPLLPHECGGLQRGRGAAKRAQPRAAGSAARALGIAKGMAMVTRDGGDDDERGW